jgi:PAS domain S-box-containing protein
MVPARERAYDVGLPVSEATQAVIFNAVPLLLLAAAYAAVTGAVGPQLWRGRGRAPALDWAVALVYPAITVASAILGVDVAVTGKPIGGHLWPSLVAAAVALVPALFLLSRWRERSLVLGGTGRVRDAQLRASVLDRKIEVVTDVSAALARAREPLDVCRPLVRRVMELLHAEFVAVAVVSDDGSEASGVYAESEGERAAWWEDVRIDLRNEPSGIASAVFDAAPVTVYDVTSSTLVSRRLAERVRAKSGAWIPMVAEERVGGVLVVATIAEKRAFTQDELALLQALASEAGLALERLRAVAALGGALARERSVADMTRRIRAQLDPDEVVRIALEELGTVLGLRADQLAVREEGEGVPVEVKGEQVATLVVSPPEPLSSGETLLVETVAREVGAALQTAQLLAENRRRLEQQAALLHAAQVVTSELDVEAVIQRLVEEVAKLLAADAADCYLLDAEHGVLRCAAVHGLDEGVVGFEFAAARGLAGEALRRGSPVVGVDYETIGATVPHPGYQSFVGAMVAPMTWSGETFGLLGVAVRDPSHRFADRDVELLEAFASLASLALRNAESFAERSRQARVQLAFYRIASLLAEPVSLAETYDAAAQAAAEALGGDFAAVLVQTGAGLVPEGGHALPPAVRKLEAPAALVGAPGEGQVVVAADVAGDERFPAEWQQAPFASLLAVPVAGEPAALVVVFFAEARSFAHDDLELAHQLAGAARGALDRARMFEAERSARSLSQQLARTAGLLASELDPAAVGAAVVEEAAALLGADAAAVASLDAGELVFVAAFGDGADASLGTRAPATGWAGGDVVQSRAPVVHHDFGADPDALETDALLTAGHRAYLGVPLLGGLEVSVHGVLAVYNRAPRVWRDEEVQALALFAANASVALANAELYQRVAVEREQSVAILANIAEGVVAVDRDGRVVLWNAAAAEITGVPASEARGRTTAQVLQRELESESGGTNRLVSIPRGGEDVWLSLSEAIMRDPSGAVAGRIFAFRDISAEHGVEQLKSDFVSTVSLELRAPLTSIYGFAQTLLRADIQFTDDERRTFLDFIARESERLTAIVDALLDVARLDRGELAVSLAPTDVGMVVSDVVAVAERAGGNSHRFVADLGPGGLAAHADAGKLRQVVDQLVSNAIKYSPSGGTVTVSARRSGDAVEVAVADEGAGIPAAEHERIFSKFYKAGDGQTRGTGLGLFIAQGLVREMGGRMWVDSEEGRGSRFTFELPLSR